MRRVEKRKEPLCLAQERERLEALGPISGKDWDGLGTCKAELFEALLQEQHGLCAYCCKRVSDKRSIEHFVTRSNKHGDETLTLAWSNLLLVCEGEYKPAGAQVKTCDKKRGNARLDIPNPASAPPNFEAWFRYTNTGEVLLSDASPSEAREGLEVAIQDTLNLNADILRQARAAVIRSLQKLLDKNDSERALLELWRTASDPDKQGFLQSHAPTARYYLRKKFKAKGLSPPAS
jgi:uncharacterized protein (TIGR02646 family)